MNTKNLHLQTIRDLIQTTVNRTHLDLERRQLIAEGLIVDWTSINSLIHEINFLYEREIRSRRERQTIDNLIIEVRLRATQTYPGLPDHRAFETSLAEGIRAYSRHIK